MKAIIYASFDNLIPERLHQCAIIAHDVVGIKIGSVIIEAVR